MNPFLASPRERLSLWKQFRTQLPALPEDEQLKRVAAFWAQAPLATYAYDPEDPTSWPTPWEMISDGDWCPSSVAIGMEFTLRMSGWDQSRLKLIYLHDYDVSERKLVVKIDDKYLLNYDYGIVSDLPKTRHEILFGWQFNGKVFVPVAG